MSNKKPNQVNSDSLIHMWAFNMRQRRLRSLAYTFYILIKISVPLVCQKTTFNLNNFALLLLNRADTDVLRGELKVKLKQTTLHIKSLDTTLNCCCCCCIVDLRPR